MLDCSESNAFLKISYCRRRVPLHRNDIVRLSEPLAASQHLSDCVQVKIQFCKYSALFLSVAAFEKRLF